MADIIGLDFGTTYSFPAFKDGNTNSINGLMDPSYRYGIPSLAHVSESGEITYGHSAEDQGESMHEGLIKSIKRKMFDKDHLDGTKKIKVNGSEFTIQQIVTGLLQDIVNEANKRADIEFKKVFHKVVMTVPVDFGEEQKKFLMECAKNIFVKAKELEIVAFLQEPVAAGFYYLKNASSNLNIDLSNPYLAVLDIGGGTTDVTVLKYVKTNGTENFEVVSQGMELLGGDQWDEQLQNFILNKLTNKYNISDGSIFQEAISKKIFTVKRALSDPYSDRYSLSLRVNGRTYNIDISLEEFNACTKELLNKAMNKFKSVVDNSNCNINQILLVGGSCNMRQIKTGVKDLYPNSNVQFYQPEHAIGYGAAYYASILNPNEDGTVEIDIHSGLTFINKTRYSYGVGYDRFTDDISCVCNLILKDTTIPTGESKSDFTNKGETTKLLVKVYESDTTDKDYLLEGGTVKRYLGDVSFDYGELVAARSRPNEISLKIDSANKLYAKIYDINSQKWVIKEIKKI